MFRSVKLIICFLAAAVFLPGMLTKAAAQSKMFAKADSLKAVSEIATENRKYTDALSRSDSAGVANCYTSDARMLNNGAPSSIGRMAIARFYGGMVRYGLTRFTYVTTGVWGCANLVVEEGTLTFSRPAGPVIVKGRYLLVWKRVHGELKIFRDTFAEDGK